MSDTSVVAPVLPNGGVLPFPPVPSASIAGRTLQESTYQPRTVPKRLHDDTPNIVMNRPGFHAPSGFCDPAGLPVTSWE
ncbi:hypothetical protein ACJH6J_28045 [Mycobacterium sp. SMC-18]|uniref:hypothetical protein n=1 Tax=Mycobacterium sp. SMC-18 TaxID=3381629 RepID=UPI0038772C6D